MTKSVALVTGASQGIGQSTAIRLARDFSALARVARNRSNLEQTAEALSANGFTIVPPALPIWTEEESDV